MQGRRFALTYNPTSLSDDSSELEPECWSSTARLQAIGWCRGIPLQAVALALMGVYLHTTMTDQEFSPLTVQLAKGLADRIPDKRKAAALEVERC